MEKQSTNSGKKGQSLDSALVKRGGYEPKNPHPILQLHSLVGNRAFSRFMQTKLQVSQPGDQYEQEADRVAEQVMRMPDPATPATVRSDGDPQISRLQRKCTQCEEEQIQQQPMDEKKEEEEEPSLQAKEVPGRLPEVGPAAQSQIDGLRGNGQPLPDSVRAFFEPRFGQDFSQVRVHTGGKASETAQATQAKAFTIGQDVVFGSGEYAPDSWNGRKLLAHELTHVIQQRYSAAPSAFIQRQQACDAPQAAEPKAQSQADQPPLAPRPGAERVWYKGVLLADDRDFMLGELRALIARHGLKGADEWMKNPSDSTVPVYTPGPLGTTPALPPRTPLDVIPEEQEKQAQRSLVPRLLPIAREVYRDKVRPEAVKLIEDFEKQAKENVCQVLLAHETQAKAEGIRYGIASEQIIKKIVILQRGGREPVEETQYETRYDMERDTPAVKGLQAAANVLLVSRQEIDKKRKERDREHRKYCIRKECEDYESPRYAPLAAKVQNMEKDYGELRAQLSAEHPALAAFSEIDKDTGDLEKIAERDVGPTVAAIIGQKIAEKLANIEKVRRGLDSGEVNVWRLPKIINVTAIQMGTDTDRWKARLVADKQEAEQPGFWQDIALLVLNIAALILAEPTGGLSLAVAAGVNIDVAAAHLEEYLRQEAMTGTTFDIAQALSQDEPSLFWLAVEVVGAAVDVGAAAGALFKALAPLAKTAQAAKEGEEAVRTLEAMRTAATAKGDATFAERVVARIKAIRGGESATLKQVGETGKEIELFEAVGKAADEAAKTGIGKGVKGIAGEVNLSASGHIYSCASPCTILRDKYAKVFARSDDVSKGLFSELESLEGKAHKAAEAHAAAKASNNADELGKAEKWAEDIKQKAADLEKRIQQAHPELSGVPSEENVIAAIKQAEAESEVTVGRLSDNVDDLEKLKPVADKPPAGISPDDPLWKEGYVPYFKDRLDALKSGKNVNVKPPLPWKEYSDFLGKFQRGTDYQKKVLKGLLKEADLAKEGKLGHEGQKLFQGMQDPIVESNVAVLEKSGKMTDVGLPVHNFPDQLIVDGATIGPGKSLKVTAVSNKSRIFDAWFKGKSIAQIQQQVLDDVLEAVSKYGGDVTLKRPTGPLAKLYGQTVSVDKVFLIYDKSLAVNSDVQRIIQDAARLPLTVHVEIVFL
jgi:uncharacterized protein DUF4157